MENTSFIQIRHDHFHNFQEATDAIHKSVSLWLPRLQHVEEDDKDDEMSPSDPISPCPIPYPSRISAAKILIELEQLDVSMNMFFNSVESQSGSDISVYFIGQIT